MAKKTCLQGRRCYRQCRSLSHKTKKPRPYLEIDLSTPPKELRVLEVDDLGTCSPFKHEYIHDHRFSAVRMGNVDDKLCPLWYRSALHIWDLCLVGQIQKRSRGSMTSWWLTSRQQSPR